MQDSTNKLFVILCVVVGLALHACDGSKRVRCGDLDGDGYGNGCDPGKYSDAEGIVPDAPDVVGQDADAISPDTTADPASDPAQDPALDLTPEVPDRSDDEEVRDDLWSNWGTRGSTTSVSYSPDGYGHCSLEEIRTDDIGDNYVGEVPADPWGSNPVADTRGRCGDDHETVLWRLANCERMTLDLEPLPCDLRLVYLGRLHSQDMIARDFFGHLDPEGNAPPDRAHDHDIDFDVIGENVAYLWEILETHLAWMDSTAHRSNILESYYTYSGVGVIYDNPFYYSTQLFLRP